MMKVVLDGQSLPDAPSLRDGLRSGIDHADAAGRIIVEALGDGQPLTESQLSNPDQGAMPGELRMRSADPRPLVVRTLRDGAELLRGLRAGQESAAQALQQGRVDEALASLRDVLDGWQTVRRVFEDSLGVLKIDLRTVEITITRAGAREHSSAADRVEALADLLRRARDHVASEDWSGLADVVGFDMDVESRAWEGMFMELATFIERAAGGSGTG